MASLVVGLGRPEEFGDEGPDVLEEGEVGSGNLPAGLQLLQEELVGMLQRSAYRLATGCLVH